MYTFKRHKSGHHFGCLYQKPKDDRSQEARIILQEKKLAEGITMLCGLVGHGKSVAVMTLANEYYNHGHNIVFVTCKENSEFDNCFTKFLPVHISHQIELKSLENPARTFPSYIYHPFTQDLPDKHQPAITAFSYDVSKALTARSLAVITGRDPDSDTVDLIVPIAQKLKPTENMFDLMYYLRMAVSQKDFKNIDKQTLAEILELKERGNLNTIRAIATAFDTNKDKYYFLRERNHALRLDFVKQIMNRRGYHFYVDKYITDEKIKYFANIMFIEQVIEACSKSKYPTVIIFEEIKHLMPKKSQLKYEETTTAEVIKNLNIARSIGKGVRAIMTTQSLYEIPMGIRNTPTDIILMPQNMTDVSKLAHENSLNVDARANLLNLGIGEGYIFKEFVTDLSNRSRQ